VAGVGYENSFQHKGGDIEAIYRRYLEAFKKGAFNFIREDIDPATRQPVPRKYFSGGFAFGKEMNAAMLVNQDSSRVPAGLQKALWIGVRLDRAMNADKDAEERVISDLNHEYYQGLVHDHDPGDSVLRLMSGRIEQYISRGRITRGKAAERFF